MAMQMQSDAAQRDHEACEQAASRAQLRSIILGLTTAFFGSVQSQKKWEKEKNADTIHPLLLPPLPPIL